MALSPIIAIGVLVGALGGLLYISTQAEEKKTELKDAVQPLIDQLPEE